jgi:hypothetical protein
MTHFLLDICVLSGLLECGVCRCVYGPLLCKETSYIHFQVWRIQLRGLFRLWKCRQHLPTESQKPLTQRHKATTWNNKLLTTTAARTLILARHIPIYYLYWNFISQFWILLFISYGFNLDDTFYNNPSHFTKIVRR